MVDAIWADQGLRHPPLVAPMPRQARRRLADATRLAIRLPARVPSWCLLHELAHAMTSSHDGDSDRHGPAFAAMYVHLLARYLRLDPAWLRATLHEAGIAVAAHARASFLDP